MTSAQDAEERGFTVDRTRMPWFAYKGPRFAPTEVLRIDEYEWSELIDALGPNIVIYNIPDESHRYPDDPDITLYPDGGVKVEGFERAGPWKSFYGEYPAADEVYDLTHPYEPDDYEPEGYDPREDVEYDEEPNPYHGTYSEE